MRDIAITDWNKFGATIKAERVRLALSQHELASRAGVSRSWLAKLEAGHRGAEFEPILRLLEALGLTLLVRSVGTAPTGNEVGAGLTDNSRASSDTTAMQELMDRRKHSAEIRRRAWSAASAAGARGNPHRR